MSRTSAIGSSASPPMRTCIGCRQVAAKRELLRVVADGERVAMDGAARLPGRGAYVHRRTGCIEAAAARGGLARAFRRGFSADSVRDFRQAAGAAIRQVERIEEVEKGQ